MFKTPFVNESISLKRLSCDLIRIANCLDRNRGNPLNGEIKEIETLVKKMNQIGSSVISKNEHIRI
jgi:hypothetical protein